MYCKFCNYYCDTNECPKCGQVTFQSREQERDKKEKIAEKIDACHKFSFYSYIFGILSVVFCLGIGFFEVLFWVSYTFSNKAREACKGYTGSELYALNSSELTGKFRDSETNLHKAKKLMKVGVVLHIINLVVCFVLLTMTLNAV